MLKKIFSHIGTGLAIGWPVTTACLWIYKAYEAAGPVVIRQFTVWLAASAMYGLISLIYDSDLPRPATVVLHFLGCLTVTFAASAASGMFAFFDPWPDWFIYVLPTFVVVYIIIGVVSCIVERCSVRKINEKIN